MDVMRERFGRWLDDQLEERGWSRSEAARRGGFSASMLNKVIAGSANPGLDLCQGIAQAFRIPLEEVFRQAGILPDSGEIPADVRNWGKRLMAISEEDRQEVIRLVEVGLRLAESKPEYRTRRGAADSEGR
jgi:transcriptional regulator with XRE-family HTH domain